MSTTSDNAASEQRTLPHRLRLLCVGPQEPPWALLALRLEAVGCQQAQFDWQSRGAEAMAKLRKTAFDCVVVADVAHDQSKSPGLGFVEALRAGGNDDPIVILTATVDDDRMCRYDELDCETLVSTAGWQSQALVSTIRRAVRRGDLQRDIAGLEQAARRGKQRDQDETGTQLQQLKDVLSHLLRAADETTDRASMSRRPELLAKIDAFYRDLLRTYVMMGTGNLSSQLRQLSELFALSGVSPHEALTTHLTHLESLVQGLGSRSSRHVMARADLLALELMIHLGECYRKKSQFRGIGDAGVDLLNAESLLRRGVVD